MDHARCIFRSLSSPSLSNLASIEPERSGALVDGPQSHAAAGEGLGHVQRPAADAVALVSEAPDVLAA